MDSHGSSLNRSHSQASGLEKSSPSWNKPSHSRSSSTVSSRHSRQVSHWEVIDDLHIEIHPAADSPPDMTTPGICEGYLLKRRKWPLKGWHKRYFVLEAGILRYSKNQQDVSRGRVQGSLDVGLAVMSINKKSNRIDLDAGDILYHMKVNAKSHELFYIWVTKLQAHRLFKKNEAAHAHGGFVHTSSPGAAAGQDQRNGDLSAAGAPHSAGAPGALPSANTGANSKVSAWLQQSHAPDTCAQGTCHILLLLSSPLSSHSRSSVLASLKSVHETLSQERQKLQAVWESNNIHQSNTLAEVRFARRLSSGFSGTQSSVFLLLIPPSLLPSATRKYRASISRTPDSAVPKSTGRRTRLPSPCPDNSHVGLMAILYNNIGKDLARVSMPAALNEPVNLLQRLCEELEYSELLDTANNTADPYQRMVYIAAFAISGYSAATFRNRYKPFNPVLGETYECVREDRGFRFISEQVHSNNNLFRWKNKFWGKSLEILPTGMVNVTLPRYGDHYEWNKVVTCINNVLSQQRYLEHYGEVTIQNLRSNVCTCKITFVKSRYWGSDTNKNEVQGAVLDQSGSVIHRFGGLWHEGIFCDTLPTPKCVWKPNPQPKDHLLFYGFSTFALELNELSARLRPLLPPTDSRLRPDQRMLEEGDVEESDRQKDAIEGFQRERRNQLAKRGEQHVPRFFEKAKDSCGRDVWLTNGTYWKIRESPGFAKTENITLW
uniref:Oxysterol binding protein-like 7 n=1 Tax=Scophthalmus maximus TaxID=52904 RepID=A0A8D3DV23_SCOMX